MDILSYLAELIKTRKEVGISGLGTIYKKKSPGRYDIDTQSFLPPSYTLDFTSEVKEEKLLAELISKKRNISLDASAYFVSQFAEDIKKQLNNNQEADFGELGTLLTAEDETLTFNPRDQQNFGFDFYGLPSLKDEIITHSAEEQINTSTPGHSDQPDVNIEPETIVEANEQAETEISDEQVTEAETGQVRETESVEETASIEEGNQINDAPQTTEEQLNLENNNADLSDGSIEFDELHHEEKEIDDDVIEETTAAPIVNEQEQLVQPIEDKVKPVWTFDEKPAFYSSDKQPDTETSKGTPLYLKVIIAILILAVIASLAAYFVRPDLFKRLMHTSAQSNVELIKNNDKLKADSIAYQDSIKRNNEKAIVLADSAKNLIKDSVIKEPVKALATDSITTWEVIGASVINQTEADRFIAQMKAIGITAKVVPNMPGKRRIKISVATFKDELSAREGRKLLVEKLNDPGIYTYQNKHTHKPQ